MEQRLTLDRRTMLAGCSALVLTATADAAPASLLRWDGHYLFLRVSVNGKPVEALLDFNVRPTLLDRRHAAMLGANPRGTGIVIEAAGRRLGPLNAEITDLADYANHLLHARIGMVIGRDLLMSGAWMLALEGPSIMPIDRQSARRGAALSLSEAVGVPTFQIAINGVPAQAAFSFNDMNRMRLSAAFAARVGLRRARSNGSASGMTMMLTDAGVDRLDVAGTRFTDVDAALEAGDHGPDAWLGPDVLRRFRIAIDLPAHMLWIDPA